MISATTPEAIGRWALAHWPIIGFAPWVRAGAVRAGSLWREWREERRAVKTDDREERDLNFQQAIELLKASEVLTGSAKGVAEWYERLWKDARADADSVRSEGATEREKLLDRIKQLEQRGDGEQ